MKLQVHKILHIFFFNLSLFLLLMIGIQNSSDKSKVNLMFWETVSLPVSFILGTSFICGSFTGSLLTSKTIMNEK